MESYEEKLNLLAEMVDFAVVDGKLHKQELLFLALISDELQIQKKDMEQLFHQEFKHLIIKSEVQRIEQFYRLALLMPCDGVIHAKEQVAINEIGIKMGLSPFAIKRVLKAMEDSPQRIISPEFLLEVFNEQHN